MGPARLEPPGPWPETPWRFRTMDNVSPTIEAIEAAAEQLTLVEGVLQETLYHAERINRALQALGAARTDLATAIRRARVSK